MERLCALVPKPRKHLVTYHGVLAPASGLRPQVVPRQREEEGEAGGCRHGAGGGVEVPESAEVAVAKAVENVAVAALLRQQAERRRGRGREFRMVAAGDVVVGGGSRGRSCCSGCCQSQSATGRVAGPHRPSSAHAQVRVLRAADEPDGGDRADRRQGAQAQGAAGGVAAALPRVPRGLRAGQSSADAALTRSGCRRGRVCAPRRSTRRWWRRRHRPSRRTSPPSRPRA